MRSSVRSVEVDLERTIQTKNCAGLATVNCLPQENIKGPKDTFTGKAKPTWLVANG